MIINSSRVYTGRDCPAKYCLTYERNIVPKRKAIPLMTGSSVHAGLASWYEHGDIEKAVTVALQEYAEETGGSYIGEEYEIIEKEQKYCEYMLREYVKAFPTEEWEMVRPEMTFKVVIGSECWKCGHIYPDDLTKSIGMYTNEDLFKWACTDCNSPIHFLIGRADMVITWKSKLWTVEHKTAKQAGSQYMESFSRKNQITTYTYGVSKQLGMRVSGTIVNVLKKTKVPDFLRDVYTRTNASLKWFEKDMIAFCMDVERWRKHNHWSQHTDQCYHFGRCPYIPICDRYEPYMDIPAEEIIPLGFAHRDPDYGDEQFIKEETR